MPPSRKAPARTSPATAEARAATARRLAAIIGQGARGAALARTLAREGVRTRAGLRRPEVLARLPREAQASVLYSPARGVPLAEADAVGDEVRRRLVFAFVGAPRPEVIPVGSVRRREPRADDLDFLVVLPEALGARAAEALGALAFRPPAAGDRLSFGPTYSAGGRRRSAILCRSRAPGPGGGGSRARNYRTDFFLATEAERPFALFHLTGSHAYNVRTRAFAKRHGWLLNQYGIFETATGRRARGSSAIRTEQDLAAYLGLTWRPPTDRAR